MNITDKHGNVVYGKVVKGEGKNRKEVPNFVPGDQLNEDAIPFWLEHGNIKEVSEAEYKKGIAATKSKQTKDDSPSADAQAQQIEDLRKELLPYMQEGSKIPKTWGVKKLTEMLELHKTQEEQAEEFQSLSAEYLELAEDGTEIPEGWTSENLKEAIEKLKAANV